MLGIDIIKYTSGDTYARHLILKAGPLKIDLSVVALEDEGCDNKLARAIVSWRHANRLFEGGWTRDHTINYSTGEVTSTRWRPTAKTYGWSWDGREARQL